MNNLNNISRCRTALRFADEALLLAARRAEAAEFLAGIQQLKYAAEALGYDLIRRAPPRVRSSVETLVDVVVFPDGKHGRIG